jgi:choline dehydrogenase-like flavoprotein
MATETLRCHTLVIGSGPGGATTACLCAEAGRDVILVEEGSHHRIDSAPNYSLLEMEQKYRNSGLTVGLGKTKITYIEGRCVGGASEINAALYHRPLPDTLREWQLRYQIDDFGPSELAPFFDATERELTVSKRPDGLGPASEMLARAAAKLGWKAGEITRCWKWTPKPGGGWEGSRQSMTETMVPRAVAAGCRVVADLRVSRLELAGTRAVAAVARRTKTGEPVRIAFEQVVVCGGAVQTPAILRRSGITANVGNTLRMHPMIRVAVRFDEPVNDPAFGVPVLQVEEFKPHLTLGCSHSSLPHLAMWMGSQVEDREARLAEWRNTAVFYAAVCGTGLGSVRSLPGFDDVFVRFPVTDADLALLGEGLHKLGQLLFGVGAREIYHPVEGAPSIKSLAQIGDLRRLPHGRLNVTSIHQFCTCPMGEDRRRCAVDSWGRLYGFDNIRLHDASILPATPGVNPQGTIMAIARRNTAKMLE